MTYKAKKMVHGIMHCDPIPNMQELQDYYKDVYFQDGKGSYDTIYTEEELQHKKYESELMVKLLSNSIGPNPQSNFKFLELGCGEGFLLSQAKEAGFDVLGVDYSSFGLTKWHPNLIDNFSQGDIYDFLDKEAAHNTFDFCAIKNLLEHVHDPKHLLNMIRKVLKPNGKIVITIPNDYSKIQNKLLDLGLVKEDEWFCPPDHLYYFNTENFVSYVNDLGFKVEDMYTSFPVDMFLFNQHSNYSVDKSKGKGAHFARIKLDLLIRDSGLDNALNLYRAMAKCGIGRALTTIISSE